MPSRQGKNQLWSSKEVKDQNGNALHPIVNVHKHFSPTPAIRQTHQLSPPPQKKGLGHMCGIRPRKRSSCVSRVLASVPLPAQFEIAAPRDFEMRRRLLPQRQQSLLWARLPARFRRHSPRDVGLWGVVLLFVVFGGVAGDDLTPDVAVEFGEGGHATDDDSGCNFTEAVKFCLDRCAEKSKGTYVHSPTGRVL